MKTLVVDLDGMTVGPYRLAWGTSVPVLDRQIAQVNGEFVEIVVVDPAMAHADLASRVPLSMAS